MLIDTGQSSVVPRKEVGVALAAWGAHCLYKGTTCCQIKKQKTPEHFSHLFFIKAKNPLWISFG